MYPSSDLLVRVAVGLLPVVAFLAGLVLIDSYKLVRLRALLGSMAAGAVAAGVCYVVNTALLASADVGFVSYSRYVAPVIEEAAKAVYLVYLVRAARVGFLVDAAIHGFALGTGFALVENVYYLGTLSGEPAATWIVRGFGTAIMHGGTTALFGIVSKDLSQRASALRPRRFLPGFALAVVLHAAFNLLALSPVVTTLVLLAVFPLLLVLVFHQSEEHTKAWLGAGFDSDQELLRLLGSRELPHTPTGQYLQTLKTSFPGEVVVDMLCLLRLHAELAIRAKGVLMMREAGFDRPARQAATRDVEAKFAELDYLEHSLGKTGLLAVAPLLHTSSRELWQLQMLGGRRRPRSKADAALPSRPVPP